MWLNISRNKKIFVVAVIYRYLVSIINHIGQFGNELKNNFTTLTKKIEFYVMDNTNIDLLKINTDHKIQ